MIVLFHKGNPEPYTRICLDRIKSTTKTKVVILSDTDHGKETVYIDPKKYKASISITNLFNTSLERFFYIRDYAEEHRLKDIITFDNDVLIYQDPLKVIPKIDRDYAFVRSENTKVVLGFCYFKSYEHISHLCEFIEKTLARKNNCLDKYSYDMVNEMTILSMFCNEHPYLVKMLPRFDHELNGMDFVFDPCSWGQYADGTPNGHPPKTAFREHDIGAQILDGKQTFKYENGKPFANDIPIFNLHIHSKRLDRW
jgi:hypothetical protein